MRISLRHNGLIVESELLGQKAMRSKLNFNKKFTTDMVLVQNGIEVIEATHLPQSSSSNSQETPENILLSFYQEFERSNRQLEKNDAAMLELFKEQNDIFRTQTTLLMKLVLK
ncbi:hypothetical protein AVEN_83013-1 [Araneus ventricosus]|uniref:Uncharacterized protein n=1 Tax=Araneus ventricosus TaxID=182803 RepID=A0A4Y2GLC9_ARAVE|nr:hypothetical protein AVEN_83013-1 [Araneus ventricosus]